MRITYDKEADAAYIYLKDIAKGEVAETIVLSDFVNIDVDAKGNTLGIEMLDASTRFPKGFPLKVSVENL